MPDNNKETHLTYQQKKSIDYTLRLREVLSELPPFCKDYFRAIEPTTSAKTRISYAYDLRIFFKLSYIFFMKDGRASLRYPNL